MLSPRLFAATCLIALFVVAQGCRYYSSKPNEGPGLTEAELKKTMEPDPNVPAKPRVFELTAEETMDLLTDPTAAEAATISLKENPRRVIGKVLERSPDNSEVPFVILDGGTHNNRAYKVKCFFAADQREAMKQVKAGDEVRAEGTSDGVLNEGSLEFKNCIFDSAAKSAAAPSAAKP